MSSFGFLGFVVSAVNAVVNVANNINNNNNNRKVYFDLYLISELKTEVNLLKTSTMQSYYDME